MKELYELVRDVLEHSTTDGVARVGMAALAWHADVDSWESEPGIALLGVYMGRHPRTAERILSSLEEKYKEIEKVRPGRGHRPARYRILVGSSRPSSTTSMRVVPGTTPDVAPGTTRSTTETGLQHDTTEHDRVVQTEQGTTTNPLSPSPGGAATPDLLGELEAQRARPSASVPVDLVALWDETHRRVTCRLRPFITATWIDPLRVVERNGALVTVEGPRSILSWTRERYGALIAEELRAAAGDPGLELELVGENSDAGGDAARNSGRRARRFARSAR